MYGIRVCVCVCVCVCACVCVCTGSTQHCTWFYTQMLGAQYRTVCFSLLSGRCSQSIHVDRSSVTGGYEVLLVNVEGQAVDDHALHSSAKLKESVPLRDGEYSNHCTLQVCGLNWAQTNVYCMCVRMYVCI